MSPFRPRPSSFEGFTLLEILVALFVLGAVLSVVFGAYSTTMFNVDATQKTLRGYDSGKTCLERMILDLESTYVAMPPGYTPPTGMLSDPDPFRFTAEVDQAGGENFPRLRFCTMAHVDLSGKGKRGLAVVEYYVTADLEGRKGFLLKRKDHLSPELFEAEERADPILVNRLVKIEYAFFDEDGEEYDSWNSEEEQYGYATPSAIEIRVYLLGMDDEESEPVVFTTRVAPAMVRPKSEQAT